MSLDYIEKLTKEHAADRALLAERVRALTDEMDAAKRRKLPGIKAALSCAKDSRVRLQALIDESRADFAKPRTRIFHGIRVGLTKGKGALKFANPAEVVKLIKKHFADLADVLIKTKETPVKKALQQLTAGDLKKLSCTIEDVGDFIVIEPADSELDKLVDALLDERKEELDDEEEAA